MHVAVSQRVGELKGERCGIVLQNAPSIFRTIGPDFCSSFEDVCVVAALDLDAEAESKSSARRGVFLG